VFIFDVEIPVIYISRRVGQGYYPHVAETLRVPSGIEKTNGLTEAIEKLEREILSPALARKVFDLTCFRAAIDNGYT
jgi:hypothetical protein